MTKYKMGAIVKNVPKGSEKWYKLAGWKKIDSKKQEAKEAKDDKTDSEKTTTT
ncbi:MAG TPA: hypothetical protein IAB59_00305 [Candidatus Onthousia faecipullorum]|uniref:Uncharacterized protein n=1 Tax=Candidatus Onthousia faecipullorum TaxID=2840887 RepID=A0A9D1KC45_9FIRM|nr:hypothetical protein [Candidatus Onthousia faecipullorum]